jgi:hypothetical protein
VLYRKTEKFWVKKLNELKDKPKIVPAIINKKIISEYHEKKIDLRSLNQYLKLKEYFSKDIDGDENYLIYTILLIYLYKLNQYHNFTIFIKKALKKNPLKKTLILF